MKILIIGGNGFVGKATVIELAANRVNKVCVAIRDSVIDFSSTIHVYKHFDLETSDWSNVLEDVDIVLHCAARVQVMNEKSNNPIQAYRKVNVERKKAFHLLLKTYLIPLTLMEFLNLKRKMGY